ncbi:TrbI/VirB10 family protein [Thiothrix sp.]|jgi:conjugal transfer pilus assembly protein TraB|uniref:TrbI/VirB10 family protein n=1 Tax=Thiothrix sp. TaxID=1032 RepID=UPI00257C14B8|nr:TrbI/VirB10 family protein [Thiothrix sp.]
MNSSVPDAASAAKKQKLLLFGGGAGVFAVLIFMMWLADDQPKAEALPTKAATVQQVEAAARKISDEELWTAKADAALQEMRRSNEKAMQDMEQLKRRNEELAEQLKGQQSTVAGLQEAAAKTPALPTLPATTANPALDGIVPPVPSTTTAQPGLPPGVPGMPNAEGMMQPLPVADEDSGMVHITVGTQEVAAVATVDAPANPNGDNPTKPLAAPQAITIDQPTPTSSGGRPLPQKRERPKAKTYIPSGTFFKAELVASLDAPTGGNAEQNPHPVLLMVTDNAFLPNRYRSKVKECHVIASGYGDISSERVNLRTEKMSCVLKDGTVIDTKLDAYVAGEDGKAGLRGNLVSKQGALIANAMLAGTLGGVGQGLAQAATTVMQTGTGTVTSVSPNQALEFGLTSGSGAAMNKLADYYIKAAEKTFPILEVASGRSVTIILLSGLDIEADNSGTTAQTTIVTDADRKQASQSLRREEATW